MSNKERSEEFISERKTFLIKTDYKEFIRPSDSFNLEVMAISDIKFLLEVVWINKKKVRKSVMNHVCNRVILK